MKLNVWVARIISILLIFQFLFPLSILSSGSNYAQAADSKNGEEARLSDAFSELLNSTATNSLVESLPAEALQEDAGPVPEKLDYFRLLDQIVIPPAEGRVRPPVLLSKLKVRTFLDGKVELYTGADPVSEQLLTGRTVLFLDFPTLGTQVFAGRYLVWLEPKTQEIQFMDLKAYENNLGRTSVPVFKIRLNAQASLSGLASQFEKGSEWLQVGPFRLSSDIFKFYSELQQVAFQFTANLVDPDSYSDLGELTDDFERYFRRATEVASDSLVQQVETLDANPIHGLTVASDLKNRLLQIEKLNDSEAIRSALVSAQKQAEVERKLGARLQLLWQRLTLPNRDAPAKISQALAMVRAGSVQGGLREILQKPAVRYGLPLASAALLGAVYPESTLQYLYQSLDLTRTVMETMLLKGQNIGVIASEASQATVGWVVQPHQVYDAYFSADKLPKTLVGLSAIVGSLYITLGLPHIMTNSVSLFKDLGKVHFLTESDSGVSRLELFKKWFIARENQRKQNYLKMLSNAESERSHSHHQFTAEDDAEVKKIFQELGIERPEVQQEVERQNQTWKERFFSKIRNWPLLERLSQKNETQIVNFRQALGHFLFGYASLTLSGFTYTQIWNAWFAFRSFLFKPSIWMTYLMYPKFMTTALRGASIKKGADLVVPSDWNGGNRGWLDEISLRWKGRSDLARTQLELLRSWEDKIIAIESRVREVAIRKAYQAMIGWMRDHDRLKTWINHYPNATHVSAEQLEALTREQRLVFRIYSEELFNQSMTRFLSRLIESRGGATPSDRELTPQRLKELSLEYIDSLQIESVNVSEWVNDVDRGGALFSEVQLEARERLFSSRAESAQIALRDYVLSKINPEANRQVSRLMAVQRQMQNPLAMARAIRSMIASNVVDKPMELMLTFLCFATVSQGFLMPIQDEMFGPNSWFYLSKYIFSTGYLSSVITGVLADTWMKLQQDELHNDQFGEVPQGDDAKKGFFSWWIKKTFKDPSNTWWKNHKHLLGIIWANMPAAFVMIAVTNLVTLGRFDLDVYLISYLLTYTLPLIGVGVKIEQGFELASYYDLKDFPEKLRSHPRVLEYFNKKVTKRRLIFNVFYKVYENTLGYFITHFSHGATDEFGTRSLSRVLFGGLTPTEWIYLGLQKIDQLFGWSPLVKGATHTCASLLTNNYTGSKVIPEPVKK